MSFQRSETLKNKREYALLTINTLNDKDFTSMMEGDLETGNYLRANIDGIEEREENIKYAHATGNPCVTSKKVNMVMKGTDKDIIDFLCTLDDKTFLKLAKDSSIREGIKQNPSLFQRYKSLNTFSENDAVDTVRHTVQELVQKSNSL